ncbi:flavin reductase [Mesorhizobium sp. M00.F.Ca.ET.151.01.1.1]|nr:flavin reductase [Mesorhizobium sp. M00.F.Ca.ET.151.01.1.1]
MQHAVCYRGSQMRVGPDSFVAAPKDSDVDGKAEVDPETFRGIFGGFPSGVTIVSATDADGAPVGLTVSAVMSLSLNPPQLVICLQSSKYTLQVIRAQQRFAVNFLASDQSWISDQFAFGQGDKFSGVDWTFGKATGAPVIKEVRAYAECRVDSLIESGDHTIVVGRLVFGAAADASPLVYHARNYALLSAHPGSARKANVPSAKDN